MRIEAPPTPIISRPSHPRPQNSRARRSIHALPLSLCPNPFRFFSGAFPCVQKCHKTRGFAFWGFCEVLIFKGFARGCITGIWCIAGLRGDFAYYRQSFWRSVMLVAVAKHYGSRDQVFPPGTYWLVELQRLSSATLFWMDDYDGRDRTGWSYQPCFAAGFASEGDARLAFEGRGHLPMGGGQVRFVEHVWEAA